MCKRGQEFLEWYSQNSEMLIKAVRKNITYDEEIFDDVIADTLCKIYTTMEKGTVVNDFKNFFFICAKFNYINAQKKRRKELQIHDRGYFDWGDIEEEVNVKEAKIKAINELYKYIADYIEDKFPSNEVDLFILYYKLKSNGSSISYAKMSKITGHSVSYITKTIRKVKEYVVNNEEIINKKKILLEECYI